jgi:hypothetical protein
MFPASQCGYLCRPATRPRVRNGIRFSRHDEYADKENQRNPANGNRHVTEQGIRYRQYTPIHGIPAGETCSVQSARCPDRGDSSGTRNAGRHLLDQEGRSLSHLLPDSLFSRSSGIPDGTILACRMSDTREGMSEGPVIIRPESAIRVPYTRIIYNEGEKRSF